jgi:transcriptional regulator
MSKKYYMTQAEVAKELGLTRSQVDLIERKALRKIKDHPKLRRYVPLLKQYLEDLDDKATPENPQDYVC